MSEYQAHEPSTTMRTVFRLAALFTALAVLMGSLVCATESGAACPTWPGCYPDQVGPGMQISPLIEFTHRLVAICAGPLVLAAAVMSLRSRQRDARIRVLPWVALAGAIAAGVFGRLVVLTGIPTWWGVVDLCCALIAMTAMTVATVALERGGRPRAATPTSIFAWTAIGTLIPMHLLGIVVAGQGSYTRCMSWPVTIVGDSDQHPWVQGVRVLLGLAAAAAILLIVKRTRTDPQHRTLGTVLLAILVVEALLGVWIRTTGLNSGLAAAFSVGAVALLWTLGLTAARTEAVDVAPHPDAAPVTPVSRD